MSTLKLFPGPFVYSEKIKNHLEIKKELIAFIENNKKNQHKCDINSGAKVITSFFENSQLFKKQSFFDYISNSAFLNDIVWNPLDKCLLELPFDIQHRPKSSVLSNIWYNYFDKDGFHRAHVHSGCFISGIYILHLNEKNPTTFFGSENNLEYYNFFYSTEEICEGSVILFPSQMWHQVGAVKSKRITISFNILSNFE